MAETGARLVLAARTEAGWTLVRYSPSLSLTRSFASIPNCRRRSQDPRARLLDFYDAGSPRLPPPGGRWMKLHHARCAGLDVHKETVVACVRTQVDGGVSHEVRTFGTTTRALLELGEWLAQTRCEQAVV